MTDRLVQIANHLTDLSKAPVTARPSVGSTSALAASSGLSVPDGRPSSSVQFPTLPTRNIPDVTALSAPSTSRPPALPLSLPDRPSRSDLPLSVSTRSTRPDLPFSIPTGTRGPESAAMTSPSSRSPSLPSLDLPTSRPTPTPAFPGSFPSTPSLDFSPITDVLERVVDGISKLTRGPSSTPSVPSAPRQMVWSASFDRSTSNESSPSIGGASMLPTLPSRVPSKR